MNYQKLFNHLRDEHGLTLVESELMEIVNCINNTCEPRWIPIDEQMPELNQTVWLTNGKGWVDLGCITLGEGGFLWAIQNGTIYQEGDKIVAECELDDDYDVQFWHELPKLIL